MGQGKRRQRRARPAGRTARFGAGCTHFAFSASYLLRPTTRTSWVRSVPPTVSRSSKGSRWFYLLLSVHGSLSVTNLAKATRPRVACKYQELRSEKRATTAQLPFLSLLSQSALQSALCSLSSLFSVSSPVQLFLPVRVRCRRRGIAGRPPARPPARRALTPVPSPRPRQRRGETREAEGVTRPPAPARLVPCLLRRGQERGTP